tara:strand:- start:79 stop:567 length:489 start_codon:yes stop_codon:yes gene_type:complete
MVNIKFVKTHENAKLPTKAHDSDNCWDLYAVEDVVIPASSSKDAFSDYGIPIIGSNVNIGHAVVPVGLNVGYISEGFGFVIKGRSGLGFKHGIVPHFGEIDNFYRGGLGVKLYNLTSTDYEVKAGDRIAQFKVEKVWESSVEFIDAVVESARGEKGFGSSGK